MKVIEILAESPESWEDATRKGVAKASESVKNIRSVYVQDMSTTIKDGKVHMFRVNVKITFMVE